MRADGHAASPGTGPRDETCGSCAWALGRKPSRRTYSKCGHQAGSITSGGATDIRLRDAACAHWKREEREEAP